MIVGLFVSTTSCSSDNDSPIDPVDPTPELPEVNTTMAQLREMAGKESAYEITEDVVFDGIVISNDKESSNFYRKLYIQNGEFGVVLSTDKAAEGDSYYKDFSIGQKVMVKAKGLAIGVSHGAVIMGKGADEKYTVGLIPDADLRNMVVAVDGGADVTPKTVAISEINDALLNTLIKVDAVQFVEGDLAKNYGQDKKEDGSFYSAANRILTNIEKETIIVRSSQYASFAEETVAQGSGSVTAVVSKYNNDYQLFIRSIDEVAMKGERFEEASNETPSLTGEKVFFSEYAEGSSSNKYVEIYNNSGADIDLANYTIRTGANGGDWSDAIELSGTLANGQMYIIAADQADPTILEKANLKLAYNQGGANPVHFNGDDAVGLFKKTNEGWSLIDVIGVQGTREKWTVGEVAAATADHTLIRKETVTTGNPDWTSASAEWDVKDQNYWNSLGSRNDEASNGGDTGEQTVVDVASGTHTIDFNDMEISAGSYEDASYTDGENVVWAITLGRMGTAYSGDNVSHDGEALMLGKETSAIKSCKFTKGVKSVTVTFYRGFTSTKDRKIELFVNGESKGVSEVVSDDTHKTFTVNDINVTGEADIEIKNVSVDGKQVIIDNLTWESME
jgi:hypothetical protein